MADKHTILMHLKAIGDFQDVVSNISQVQTTINKLKLPKTLTENFSGIFGDLAKEAVKYQKILDSGFKKKGDITNLESSGERINNLLRRMQKEMSKISETDLRNSFQIDPKQLEVLNKELAEAKKNLQEFMASGENAGSLQTVQNAVNSIKEISKTKFADEFQKAFASGNMDAAAEALRKLNANANKFTENSEKAKAYGAAIKILTEQLQSFQGNTSLQEFAQRITEIQGRINNFETDELRAFLNLFTQQQPEVEKLTNDFNNYNNAVKDSAHSQYELGAQISQLKNRALYFLSLTNSVQLFKRAVRSALDTVKELDATMTEAAVVTDFSVGDMWEKLPEYSKEAQKLGIEVNDMYQATTLYYQQGLKNNAAMALGIETMKMGKIAAMDSSEATKAMTAALRGFNMELNETSATRVNDVYSQLAAVTAADTSQIATAMEKTASIAASANMEFETTAALLAQIIETTQEAPETAGTAMKTIIARFAEVKNLRTQGLTTGEDEEGEGIDVNKIQTALRSVGISMEGFFAGTEGLDSVLLKLAEKWSTLDFETQRYIATTAAGSRQQSRFIAMMSDYGRTIELVEGAQNSTGASQEQFQKTQESLATSLNKLTNAWDEFLMGLANEGILKNGIDALTKLLETINKVTTGISGGHGLLKSAASLIGIIGVLKTGSNLINGVGAGTAVSGVAATIASKLGMQQKQRQGSVTWKEWQKAFSEKNSQNRFTGLSKKFSKYTDEDKRILSLRMKGKLEVGDMDDESKKQLEGLKKQLDEGKISTDKAAKSFKECGGEIEDLGKKSGGVSDALSGIGQAAGVAGAAFMGLGTATSLLATYFESVGMEEAAENTQKVAGALIGVGAALSAISAIMPILTALTTAQGAATLAALWPVLAVVAGLAALLAIIGAVSKARFENSIEGQMQAAAEATEKAKEAAEAANNAYDELLSAKDGYSELQNQLDSLTKGTLEWKAALAESNNQVLELLKTYPQLSGYLIRGQHGELEISEAGWDYINEYSSNAVANSQAALIASQIDETKLKRKSFLISLEREMYENYGMVLSDSVEGEWVGEEGNFMRELLEEYRENPSLTYENSKALKNYQQNENNWFDGYYGKEEFQEIVLAISKLEAQLKENDKVIEAQTEALIGAQVSSEAYKYDYAKEVVAGISHGYAKNIEASESGYKSRLMEKDEQILEKLVVDYNIDTTLITEDYNANLAQIYAAMTNQSIDDLDDSIKNNYTYLIKEISKIAASDNAARVAETTIEKMSKMTKQEQQDYSVLLSGDISNATQSFTTIESFDANVIQKELGFKTRDQMLNYLGFDKIDDLEKRWMEIVDLAYDGFESIFAQAERNNINTYKNTYFKGATHSELKSYVDLMSYSLTTEASKELEESFISLFTTLNLDKRDQIVTAMNSFDWTLEGEDEAFLQFLKGIGVELDETNPAIKEFLKQLDMSNAIFRDFDVSNILDSVKEGLEEAEEIGESDRLSNEQFEKYYKEGLIKNIDAWSWDGKGWVNIENGMTDLVEALKENTLSNYKLTVDEAKAQVDYYNDKMAQFKATETNTYGEVFVGGKESFIKPEELASYLVREGLPEAIWSRFFASFKEYEEWGKLYNGGLANAELLLKADEKFDTNNIQLGSDIDETWENSYDKYYNTVKKINAELRSREQIERQYQRLQERGIATEEKAADLRQKQLDSLKEESKLREALLSKRESQMYEIEKEYSDVGQYAGWDNNLRQVQIDWSKINQLDGSTNEELTSRIEEFISKLEEQQELIEEEEDALQEINDIIWEIYQQGKDEYFNLENKIKDAIIASRQDEIDKLNNINETINTTNEKLISSIQSQLELERQQRENNNTEQEIADKQARLAYLQQDTSGANALEIMKLQEEIDKAQEDYTDTLIDQKISELQQQNEQAAEQRQQQIDILQSQLDYDISNGQIWEEVRELIDSGFNTETGLLRGSALEEILQKADNFKGLSALEQLDWYKDMDTNMALALSWLKTGATQSLYGEGKQVSFTTADGKVKVGTMDKEGNIITEDGFYAAGTFDMDSTGAVSSSITEQQARKAKAKRNEDDSSYSDEPEKPKQPQQPQSPKYWTIEDFEFYDKGTKYSSKQNAEKAINDWYKSEKNNILKDKNSTRQMVRMEELDEEYEYFANKIIPHYKTGGLADFTGPAWLDGTKSRPEYILNANQTKAFFSLVDVLSSLKAGTSKTPEKSGDNTYDIDINVESIGSDYDVEQLANTIKRLINDDARYRNNNTINLMR